MRKNLQHLTVPVKNELESSATLTTNQTLLKEVTYTKKDIEGFNYLHSSSGKPPYLRGTSTLMYTQKPLPIAYSIFITTKQEGNTLLKKAIKNNLSIFYLDHKTLNTVNNVSLEKASPDKLIFNTLNDIEVLFKDIDITKNTFYIPCNNAILATIALFLVYAEQHNLKLEKLKIVFTNNSSKNWSNEQNASIMLDVFNYLSKKAPNIKLLNICDINQKKEITAPTQIANAITAGLINVNSAIKNGINIDQFASSLVFNYNPGLNIFLEIAKTRATRMLWVKCLNAYKPKNQNSSKLQLQTKINSNNKLETANNIAKHTVKASIANLAGIDCIINNTENKATLIVQEETGINKTIDALGGSYYIESLTNQLANKAWLLICKHNTTQQTYKNNTKKNELEKTKQDLVLLTGTTNLNKSTNFLELAINAVKNGTTAHTINLILRP